jgi:hypothetical protein
MRRWAATLQHPWRAPVERALAARDQFDAIVAQLPPGPTRDRLTSKRPVLDQAVAQVADAVWRAGTAAALGSTLDLRRATDELKAARRELSVLRARGADTDAAEARVAALAERHRAVTDTLNVADDTTARLDELNLRLDTAVARAAAIAVRATHDGGLDELDRELHSVVAGLGALDAALRELDA